MVSGENVLYLAGGEFPDGTVTRCLCRYDPVLDEWHDLAPMSRPRSELGKGCLCWKHIQWDMLQQVNVIMISDTRTVLVIKSRCYNESRHLEPVLGSCFQMFLRFMLGLDIVRLDLVWFTVLSLIVYDKFV